MLQWNKDWKQQNLALMLAVARDVDRLEEVETFINSQGWNRDEKLERIVHAISLARVKHPDHFETA